MSKTQLITFTPMDAFFFGGEITFGNGDSRNFFAASNYFPQQTTIAGVLRHALFEAGHKNHIGKSFVVGEKPDFGYLEKLSPVFIHYKKGTDEEFAIPLRLPLDEKEGDSEPELFPIPVQCGSSEMEKINVGFGWQEAPVVNNYKEKNGIRDYLLFSSGKLNNYDYVFLPVNKTGIARDRNKHTTLEGMFYRQTLYRMKEGFSFAAFVTGDDQLFEILDGRNMPMGGEKMNFVIKVYDKPDSSFDHLFDRPVLHKWMDSNRDWVFLASDAYVSSEIYKHCYLAITDTRDFRNIITPESNEYSDNLARQKNGKKRYKSEKFSLLRRGSILFPKENLKDVTDMLNNLNFHNIGYNHFFNNQKNK